MLRMMYRFLHCSYRMALFHGQSFFSRACSCCKKFAKYETVSEILIGKEVTSL